MPELEAARSIIEERKRKGRERRVERRSREGRKTLGFSANSKMRDKSKQSEKEKQKRGKQKMQILKCATSLISLPQRERKRGEVRASS